MRALTVLQMVSASMDARRTETAAALRPTAVVDAKYAVVPPHTTAHPGAMVLGAFASVERASAIRQWAGTGRCALPGTTHAFSAPLTGALYAQRYHLPSPASSVQARSCASRTLRKMVLDRLATFRHVRRRCCLQVLPAQPRGSSQRQRTPQQLCLSCWPSVPWGSWDASYFRAFVHPDNAVLMHWQ
jgi:hypothetical protein